MAFATPVLRRAFPIIVILLIHHIIEADLVNGNLKQFQPKRYLLPSSQSTVNANVNVNGNVSPKAIRVLNHNGRKPYAHGSDQRNNHGVYTKGDNTDN